MVLVELAASNTHACNSVTFGLRVAPAGLRMMHEQVVWPVVCGALKPNAKCIQAGCWTEHSQPSVRSAGQPVCRPSHGLATT